MSPDPVRPHDLHDLLDRGAGPAPAADPGPDVLRGRAALRRRRARRTVAGSVVAVAAVVGAAVALPHLGGGRDAGSDLPVAGSPSASPSAPEPPEPSKTLRSLSELASGEESDDSGAAPGSGLPEVFDPVQEGERIAVGPFTVGEPPAGWHVVGGTSMIVMIARDGTDPDVLGGFVGHIVIGTWRGQMTGTTLVRDGVDYVCNGAQCGREVGDGRWIQVQAPDGFTDAEAVAYLATVEVGPGADYVAG